MCFLVLLGVAIVTPIIIIISLSGSIPTFWQVWNSFSAERPHQHFARTLVFIFGLPEYLSEPRYVRNEFLVGFNHVSFSAFFHLILDDDPNWCIFFSGGSMPPTGFGSKKNSPAAVRNGTTPHMIETRSPRYPGQPAGFLGFVLVFFPVFLPTISWWLWWLWWFSQYIGIKGDISWDGSTGGMVWLKHNFLLSF
jgi:hypothetical protein